VGWVAGRFDEAWGGVWDVVCAGDDCANSEAEKVMLAMTADRIRKKERMWLIGRATTAEVTRREDALL
jgi:hypothetical protein